MGARAAGRGLKKLLCRGRNYDSVVGYIVIIIQDGGLLRTCTSDAYDPCDAMRFVCKQFVLLRASG